jgi:hypothetical protein
MGNTESGTNFELPTTGKEWLLRAWILEARVNQFFVLVMS